MGKSKKNIQCEIKHYNEDKSNLTTCINSSMLTDLSMTFHDAVSGSYKHEYCRGSPVSSTGGRGGVGQRGCAVVVL